MKSTAKKLARSAVLLCLTAYCFLMPVSAVSPLIEEENGITLPWNQSISAESIETGNYSSNMLLGSSQQLSPVVRPSYSTDSVVFLSDDTTVLTVTSSGIVQAVGVGTATITAAAGDQFCAYTIAVSMDSTMIVTAMDLALSSNTIYVGDSVSASLQVLPSSAANYATVTLTSSNEKVATVNNFGRVTGVSPGTATITATCGSVTASSKITVIQSPASSNTNSGQVITPSSSYVVLKPGATRTITATATPSSASQSFTFKSNNSSIATVSPTGVITAVGTGSTYITVSNGKASALVTVIVNRSASASEDESGSGSTLPDEELAPLDPVVQAIQDSTENEVVFAQEEVPLVTSEILNSLRTTGKTLCVVGDGYTLKIPGSGIKSTTNELDTLLTFVETEYGIEFVLDNGRTLPCTVQIELDVSNYSRLYLYNPTSGKWQYLNSYENGVVTADTAGRYLLTNQNLRFANIDFTFFIAGGIVVVLIAVAYIAVKKRYWFW